jgi:hypothetical protein
MPVYSGDTHVPAPFKFGYLDQSKKILPFDYDDTWAVEKTSGPERLVIAPRRGQIGMTPTRMRYWTIGSGESPL